MKQLLLVLVAACVFAACKSSTTPTDTTTYHKVTLHDAFTFDNFSVDDAGGVIAGSRDTTVHMIDAVNLTMDGKTSVFRAIEVASNGVDFDTTYYSYESNNDLSMMVLSVSQEKNLWVKLPTASSGAFTTTFRDTTTDSKGDMSIENDTIIATSMGDETMSIAGTNHTVRKISLSFSMSVKSPSSSITFKQNGVGYYTPTFGYIARLTNEKSVFGPARDQRMIGHAVK